MELDFGFAQPAQTGHVPIFDPRRKQARRQILAIELRIVTGTRHSSHIDQSSDTVGLQYPDEFFDRASGMPDRANRKREWRLVFHLLLLGYRFLG